MNMFPSGSSQLSPRSVEARKEVFKLLSETLRPPTSGNLDADSNDSRKSSFPKINTTSGRKPGRPKNNLSFQTLHSQSGRHGPKNSVMRNNGGNKRTGGRGGKGKGGGGGDDDENPALKENCHLNNVLRSAHRCLNELREAKDCLSDLVAEDDQLARGIRKSNPTEEHKQLGHVALSITNLCREAFIPAHRLNQTAIALYCAEDFLRYPSDIRTFDLQSSKGRIKLPDVSFNNATVMKLRQVVDLAAETYNKFNGKGRLGEDLQEILFCILRGYQDFYAATLGCQEIFKVLLYTGPKDKAHLQQFLLALSPMDRSDLLVDIQELRRTLDEIVIFLEKLSWGSFVVYRLAGGSAGGDHLYSSYSDDQFIKRNQQIVTGIPTYPAYPLLKAKGPKLMKQKKSSGSGATEDSSMEPSGIKLSVVQGSSLSMLSGEKRQGNSMKKSKFSRKKNINAGAVERHETPVGDASFPTLYKNSDSTGGGGGGGGSGNFMRIDANANKRSMISLEK